MKKLVVTLNIGNYLPEITALTLPFIHRYAAKIGADFLCIDKRLLTEEGDGKPINYEKFQLRDIAVRYDWTYFLDCDAFVHPDCPDWAEMVGEKSVVIFSGVDNRTTRFRATHNSRRSGCSVGACTWNVICSNWTADLWTPPDSFELAVENIVPIWGESKSGHCAREHLIDDYQLSENIARFGLKVDTMHKIAERHGFQFNHYSHLYNCDPYEKLKAVRGQLDALGVKYP